MSYPKAESEITALLEANLEIRCERGQVFKVTHIPFMGTREHFFILINVLLEHEIVDREKLLNISMTASKLAISSGLLTNEKAVEVDLYLAREHIKVKRLIRYSILDFAFTKSLELTGAEVQFDHQDGVSCQWPLIQ